MLGGETEMKEHSVVVEDLHEQEKCITCSSENIHIIESLADEFLECGDCGSHFDEIWIA